MEFDDITLAAQAQLQGADRQAARDPNAGPRFIRAFMGALVKDIPLRRELIVRPDLLDMNERALPLTKQEMLKRGNRQET